MRRELLARIGDVEFEGDIWRTLLSTPIYDSHPKAPTTSSKPSSGVDLKDCSRLAVEENQAGGVEKSSKNTKWDLGTTLNPEPHLLLKA